MSLGLLQAMNSRGKVTNESSLSAKALEYYQMYAGNEDLPKYFCGKYNLPPVNQAATIFTTTTSTLTSATTSKSTAMPTKTLETPVPITAKASTSGIPSSAPIPIIPEVTVEDYGELSGPSPTSSVTSGRKLEWDSGADIGYSNCELNKSLYKSNSMPSLPLIPENLIVVEEVKENLDKIDNHEQVLDFLRRQVGNPNAESTPANQEQMRKSDSDPEIYIVHTPAKPRNHKTQKLQKSIFNIQLGPSEDVGEANENVEPKNLLKCDEVECLDEKECNVGTQTTHIPANSNASIGIQTSRRASNQEILYLFHSSDKECKSTRSNSQNSPSDPINSQSSQNAPSTGSDQFSNCNSFEYLGPKSLNTTNKDIKSLNTKRDIKSVNNQRGNDKNLKLEVQKSLGVLQKLIKSKKYDPKTKELFVRKLASKLLDVTDTTTTTTSTETPRTTTTSQETGTSQETATSHETATTRETVTTQETPRDTGTPQESLKSKSSTQESSGSSKSWKDKDNYTKSENVYITKKQQVGNSNDVIVSFAKKERENQLNWINNEIRHLARLKDLLESKKKAPLVQKNVNVGPNFKKSTSVYVITTERTDSKPQKERMHVKSRNKELGEIEFQVHNELGVADYKFKEIVTRITTENDKELHKKTKTRESAPDNNKFFLSDYACKKPNCISSSCPCSRNKDRPHCCKCPIPCFPLPICHPCPAPPLYPPVVCQQDVEYPPTGSCQDRREITGIIDQVNPFGPCSRSRSPSSDGTFSGASKTYSNRPKTSPSGKIKDDGRQRSKARRSAVEQFDKNKKIADDAKSRRKVSVFDGLDTENSYYETRDKVRNSPTAKKRGKEHQKKDRETISNKEQKDDEIRDKGDKDQRVDVKTVRPKKRSTFANDLFQFQSDADHSSPEKHDKQSASRKTDQKSIPPSSDRAETDNSFYESLEAYQIDPKGGQPLEFSALPKSRAPEKIDVQQKKIDDILSKISNTIKISSYPRTAKDRARKTNAAKEKTFAEAGTLPHISEKSSQKSRQEKTKSRNIERETNTDVPYESDSDSDQVEIVSENSHKSNQKAKNVPKIKHCHPCCCPQPWRPAFNLRGFQSEASDTLSDSHSNYKNEINCKCSRNFYDKLQYVHPKRKASCNCNSGSLLSVKESQTVDSGVRPCVSEKSTRTEVKSYDGKETQVERITMDSKQVGEPKPTLDTKVGESVTTLGEQGSCKDFVTPALSFTPVTVSTYFPPTANAEYISKINVLPATPSIESQQFQKVKDLSTKPNLSSALVISNVVTASVADPENNIRRIVLEMPLTESEDANVRLNEDVQSQARKNALSNTSMSSTDSSSGNEKNYPEQSTSSSSISTSVLCSCCRKCVVRSESSLVFGGDEEQNSPVFCWPCYQQCNNREWNPEEPFYNQPDHSCKCYTMVDEEALSKIRETLRQLHEMECESKCMCPDKKMFCKNCFKNSKKRSHRAKKPVAYLLKFDQQKPPEEEPGATEVRSLQEVRVPLPYQSLSDGKRHRQRNKKKVSIDENKENRGKKRGENRKKETKESKNLQEYLASNRPDFVKSAEERRRCLIELAYMREQRCQKYKQLLALTNGQPVQNQGYDDKREFRIFSTKQMKTMTAKNYKKLPEVQQKLLENRERQMRRANKMLADIFNKKLKESVLRGQVSLSTSISVINLL